jgi:hypothetical protein
MLKGVVPVYPLTFAVTKSRIEEAVEDCALTNSSPELPDTPDKSANPTMTRRTTAGMKNASLANRFLSFDFLASAGLSSTA